MSKEKKTRVCSVENAGGLDNSIRKFLQNPQKIVKPFINEGMSVLDLGCGPGVFTIEIAKMLNNSGKVIAADLQEGMLDKVRQKISGTELDKLITLHKCLEESIGVVEKVDFILAFYMIHEVPNQDKLFGELLSILNPNGLIFIVEPKFHVPKKSFELMVDKLKNMGLNIVDRPKVFFSRSVVLAKKEL